MLVEFLVARGHSRDKVRQQVSKALETSRAAPNQDQAGTETLRKCTNSRVPLVVQYHPGLPDIRGILSSLQPALHQSVRLQQAIPETPLLCFKQPKSLKDMLVRARVDKRDQKFGPMKPCSGSRCELCPMLDTRKRVKSTVNGRVHQVKAKDCDCNAVWIIYCITCPRCKLQYIGKTNDFRLRMNNHKKDLRNYVHGVSDTNRLYEHLQSHSVSDTEFRISIVECILSADVTVRSDRSKLDDKLTNAERYWIAEMQTLWPLGLGMDDGYHEQTRKPRRRKAKATDPDENDVV